MRDKVLAYALAVSVGVHIVILCVVGKTYSASPTGAPVVHEQASIRVNVETPASEQNKPRPVVKIRPELLPERQQPAPEPAQPKAPIFHNLASRLFGAKPAPAPTPAPVPVTPAPPVRSPIYSQTPVRTASAKLPGNPGGALNLGSGSSHGENLGSSGHTPVGWVPGSPNGNGAGSGNGAGVGTPEPVHNAVEGPGHEAAPAPPPPPPAPDVDVKVCSESGMLPGPNCENTVTRSFRPGHQPDAVCNVCRPKHVSTLADRSVPEFISGHKAPRYPESARDKGIEGSVTVEYTISTEGSVEGARVSSSSGNSDLDRAAVESVESRKYKPAVQAGIPRNYRKRETFHFALDQ